MLGNQNMKKNIKINPKEIITSIIKKSNLVIFIVIVSFGLIFVVNCLTNIFIPQQQTTNQQANSTQTNTGDTNKFDQATIDKINNLKTSIDNSGDQPLPSGRINPFSE